MPSRRNQIEIASASGKGFLNLFLFSDQDLIDFYEHRKHSPHVFAELIFRYYFSEDEDLRKFLTQHLNLLDQFISEIRQNVFSNTLFSGKKLDADPELQGIKNALSERWNYLRGISGTFPVCTENDAWILPFTFHFIPGMETSSCADADGEIIPEWDIKIKELHLSPSCRVEIGLAQGQLNDLHIVLEGASLQLSVYLAHLVAQQNLLPYDPFRLMATGALADNRLESVRVEEKYKALSRKYPHAYLLFPVPKQEFLGYCQENMLPLPFGASLEEIKNKCKEYILEHGLNIQTQRRLNSEVSITGFVGRHRELSAIHRILNSNHKIPFIHGAPGMGKTALALEYARLMTPFEYPKNGGFALLNAGGAKNITEIFRQLWDDLHYRKSFGLKIPEEMLARPEELLLEIKDQLNSLQHSILILFDNVSYELQLNEELKKFFPEYSNENIQIIATGQGIRFSVTENDPVFPMELEGLSETDAIDLLKSKRPFESSEELDAAQKIISFLGGNAWAVDVVGESLKQLDPKYPDDYREKWAEMQKIPLKEISVEDPGLVRTGLPRNNFSRRYSKRYSSIKEIFVNINGYVGK